MTIRTNPMAGAPARYAALAALAVSIALLAPAAPAWAGNPNPGVVPPHSKPLGLSYGEWSARWFKWALEKTKAQSPLLDPDGHNCAIGQTGKVWFLAGTFFPPGPPSVVRQCRIPAGKMIFFPVGNGFCAGDGLDFAGEQACATQYASQLSGFRAEVDGVRIRGMAPVLQGNYYRALSPEWDLVLPADNIFDAPAGIYSPGAGDGVYLMLEPLTPGSHLIRFRADLAGGGAIEATYHLLVGYHGH